MKRKLKTFRIIFIILIAPFVINFVNLIIIFSLRYRFGIADDSIPFVTHLIGLILLFILLWIIFIKTKEKYLADSYMVGICFVSIFIGMSFFAIETQVYPYLSSW